MGLNIDPVTRLTKYIFAAWLLVLFSAIPSSATTLERLSLEGLSVRSDAIVCGNAKSVRTGWGPGNKMIYTYYTIQLTDIVAQNDKEKVVPAKGASIEIMVPGGRVGDMETIVSGVPVIANGDDVLLFLRQRIDKKGLIIYGLSQGHYKVTRNPDNGKLMVQGTVNEDQVKFVGKEKLAPQGPMLLEDMTGMVKNYRIKVSK